MIFCIGAAMENLFAKNLQNVCSCKTNKDNLAGAARSINPSIWPLRFRFCGN